DADKLRGQRDGALVKSAPLAAGPGDLALVIHFRRARFVELVDVDYALRVLNQPHRQDAVGIWIADDFVGRLLFDLLADCLRKSLAQVWAEAVRLDHRYVDGRDVGRKEAGVAEMIGRAAGEKQKR